MNLLIIIEMLDNKNYLIAIKIYRIMELKVKL